MRKEKLAELGLLLITFWSAIQYIFLQNVPDTVSTFAFICITNVLGITILAIAKFQKLMKISKKVLCKGAVLALELVGFNFFLLIGSRNMDSVVISSVVSMYFLFITPLLILLRKKISFRSLVATIVALVALVLMFNADTATLFSSPNVIYLIISDFFFATYVVSISVLGEKEDSYLLTIGQMLFSILFSAIGWIIELKMGVGEPGLPKDMNFWISVIFIGIFIRALYGIIQVSCQKKVAPLAASLIFSSEIIITLILNPFLCRIFQTEYTPPSIFQVVGCVFFVIAILVIDDSFMKYFGYSDMEFGKYIDENGVEKSKASVSRKLVNTTLIISMSALIISTIICLWAIKNIQLTTISTSSLLGTDAATKSESALMLELEKELNQAVTDKAKLAQSKLSYYSFTVKYAASFASELLSNPDEYPRKEAMYPLKENGGKWVMQRSFENEDIAYESLRKQNALLGNLESVFAPIIQENPNIATIYAATEEGLLLSYDTGSDSAYNGGEVYYDYFDSDWYLMSKNCKDYAFTDTYLDSYGRGLTITCVAPIYDEDGLFRGCIGMDILMHDLNQSIVSEGISEPNKAIMIDSQGKIIASEDVDEYSSVKVNIFDKSNKVFTELVADEILKNKNGIITSGEGNDAIYISYSGIELTDWILCIFSPVSHIVEPAKEIREGIDQNTSIVTTQVSDSIRAVIQNCLILFVIIILGVTVIAGKIAKRLSDPLKILELDVQKIAEGNFDQRTAVNTDDEIGSLARAFNFMTESIQRYLIDLKEATVKEERIASELSVATQIQASMLPGIFPAFPDRKEIDIYATMTPAKEVGGDFYDFFFVDETHLAIVMADVSGKGVPAALFMVIGKTLIKDHTLPGRDLGEIFTEVNSLLCESNKEGLFITAFEGVLDLKTGEFVFVNAGHELPFICKKGENFKPYQVRRALVLAGMEDMKYKSGVMELEPGDRVFQYTDGVTEATNANNELYGMKRLENILNENLGATPKELLAMIKEDIDLFVDEAQQFDDITMLCLEYKEKYLG